MPATGDELGDEHAVGRHGLLRQHRDPARELLRAQHGGCRAVERDAARLGTHEPASPRSSVDLPLAFGADDRRDPSVGDLEVESLDDATAVVGERSASARSACGARPGHPSDPLRLPLAMSQRRYGRADQPRHDADGHRDAGTRAAPRGRRRARWRRRRRRMPRARPARGSRAAGRSARPRARRRRSARRARWPRRRARRRGRSPRRRARPACEPERTCAVVGEREQRHPRREQRGQHEQHGERRTGGGELGPADRRDAADHPHERLGCLAHLGPRDEPAEQARHDRREPDADEHEADAGEPVTPREAPISAATASAPANAATDTAGPSSPSSSIDPTAARLAPPVTPRMSGLASGFRRVVWKSAPPRPSAVPAMIAASTRGQAEPQDHELRLRGPWPASTASTSPIPSPAARAAATRWPRRGRRRLAASTPTTAAMPATGCGDPLGDVLDPPPARGRTSGAALTASSDLVRRTRAISTGAPRSRRRFPPRVRRAPRPRGRRCRRRAARSRRAPRERREPAVVAAHESACGVGDREAQQCDGPASEVAVPASTMTATAVTIRVVASRTPSPRATSSPSASRLSRPASHAASTSPTTRNGQSTAAVSMPRPESEPTDQNRNCESVPSSLMRSSVMSGVVRP